VKQSSCYSQSGVFGERSHHVDDVDDLKLPLLDLIGFWPVIISIGMPPDCAYAAPVTKFVAPSPSGDKHKPALPVRRP